MVEYAKFNKRYLERVGCVDRPKDYGLCVDAKPLEEHKRGEDSVNVFYRILQETERLGEEGFDPKKIDAFFDTRGR